MQQKVCMVTGGNRGIGLEVVNGLARAGAHVVLVSRSRERGEAAARESRQRMRRDGVEGGGIEVMSADLASLASVRKLAEDFILRHDRLDILVNNAAVISDRRILTIDGIEMQFAVNHLAPFLLTNLLLARLRDSAPSRIVNVASNAHRRGKIHFDDLQWERRYERREVYAGTKLANVLFTLELDRRLRERRVQGIAVNAVHPGVIATGLLETLLGRLSFFAKLLPDARTGARPVLALALDPELEGRSGSYFHRRSRRLPSPAARDPGAAKRLWEVSAALCGLAGEHAGEGNDGSRSETILLP